MASPAKNKLFILPESLFRREARRSGNSLVHIHGGERDAPADANLIRGAAHLIGIRAAGFKKACGPATDHGGIARDAAPIDIFRSHVALKRNKVARPNGI